MSYAANTTVPVEKTRAEIEKTLHRRDHVMAELRQDVADLQRTITQLQEANTREVKRRRHAEAVIRTMQHLLKDTVGITRRSNNELDSARIAMIEALDRIQKGDFE